MTRSWFRCSRRAIMLPHFKRQLCEFVERNIPDFHCRRLESLKRLKLKDILRRKNPYLFRQRTHLRLKSLCAPFWTPICPHRKKRFLALFLSGLPFLFVNVVLMARNQPPKALTWNLCVMMFYTSYPSCPGQIGEIAVS